MRIRVGVLAPPGDTMEDGQNSGDYLAGAARQDAVNLILLG
jgi:hypothetical protein